MATLVAGLFENNDQAGGAVAEDNEGSLRRTTVKEDTTDGTVTGAVTRSVLGALGGGVNTGCCQYRQFETIRRI